MTLILLTSFKGLLDFFKNDFVIHGRVFRPFYAKDHSVFLFELNSIYTFGRILPDPHDDRISFDQFLEWHNPMTINKNQVISHPLRFMWIVNIPPVKSLAKWCARMALGLSNSVPGVEIAAENYNEINDICWYKILTTS